MAESLKQEIDVTVLVAGVERSAEDGAPVAAFRLEAAREVLLEHSAPLEALGVPATSRRGYAAGYGEPDYRVPEELLQELERRLPDLLARGEPLWLQLAANCGILPAVPWERLLQPALAVPILRLPYYAVLPVPDQAAELDVVLCASSPPAKTAFDVVRVFDTFTRRILDAVGRESLTIHLFCGADVYPALARRLEDRIAGPGGRGVRIYDPGEVGSGGATQKRGYSALSSYGENTWLRWILDALAGRSVDVVHFIGHGFLASDQGSFAFADTPLGAGGRASFAGAQQLSEFATLVGAWSVGFSAPQPNYSRAGLWMLADQVARLRPAPVFVHDLALDREASALAAVYNLLFGETAPGQVPGTDAVGLYCHPAAIGQVGSSKSLSPQADSWVGAYTLLEDSGLESARPATKTPDWISSTQRYIEQSVSQMQRSHNEGGELEALSEGTADALSFLSAQVQHYLAGGGEPADVEKSE